MLKLKRLFLKYEKLNVHEIFSFKITFQTVSHKSSLHTKRVKKTAYVALNPKEIPEYISKKKHPL